MALVSGNPLFLALFFAIVSLLISPSQSEVCSTQKFTNNKLYAHCNDLPTLNAYLHYTYESAQSTLSLAFIAAPAKPDGWIAWALNPTGEGMLGAQTLIAFKGADGGMVVRTYNVTSYAPIQESKVWFTVKEANAEYVGGVMRLFATVVLPEKGKTTLNHVWQVGSSVTKGVPDKHEFQPGNMNAKGTLDLLSGQSNTVGASADSSLTKKNIHGILNAISFAFLFPLGIICARYLRTFEGADPAWFYLHISCQISAYVLGVAGWGTGMKLGSESKGIVYSYHRCIGITLFVLATVQMFALFLRPNKDHKYRFYWNIYHHGIGYTILVLGIINVFKGIAILSPEKKWKSALIAVLIILGAIAVLLEAITWVVVLKRKSNKSTKPLDGYADGQGKP